MTSKDVIKWVYGKVREELTIQKPSPAMAAQIAASRKSVNKGDAAKGFMILIIAPVIFCILAVFII